MNILKSLTLITILLGQCAYAQEMKQLQEQICLSGKQLILLEVAVQELRKRELNLLSYKGTLYEKGDGYVVIFKDPNTSPSQRGSPKNLSSFEVEMDSDFRVTRANFVR